jgi:uncharacterized protein HemX
MIDKLKSLALIIISILAVAFYALFDKEKKEQAKEDVKKHKDKVKGLDKEENETKRKIKVKKEDVEEAQKMYEQDKKETDEVIKKLKKNQGEVKKRDACSKEEEDIGSITDADADRVLDDFFDDSSSS